MRIGVVGAGALGLYYGALLQKGGNRVAFLLRRDYEAIRERGLKVLSPSGDFHLETVEGCRTPEEMGTVDLVIVGLKTFANNRFAELITPLVGKDTLILTLQNGLGNEEALASLFGPERILGGVAFLCSNRGTPGVVHHLGAGKILLGSLLPAARGQAERIAAILGAAGIDCQSVADLRKARWEKLVWNVPFNGLCAITLRTVDDLLAHSASRDLVREIMLEVIAAAKAQGLNEVIPATYADGMIAFSEGLGRYRPSMMIDRIEGRQLELDAIFGRPLTAGMEGGIPMPQVRMLHTLLDIATLAR
ncbi:MAG: putative 2-dehydropantoate 2-reductase [Desulfuromonadales bacterium]|nr:MAG: putative 2-dehydropantoate 2-reductase [Desulfuromonadales bacterium]